MKLRMEKVPPPKKKQVYAQPNRWRKWRIPDTIEM